MMGKLRWAVQALAMPAVKQIELFPEFVNVADELALAWEEGLSALINIEDRISSEQLNAIRSLDNKMLAMSGERNHKFWTEKALRESSEWEELRVAAAMVAKKMGWPVEAPGAISGFYIGPPE